LFRVCGCVMGLCQCQSTGAEERTHLISGPGTSAHASVDTQQQQEQREKMLAAAEQRLKLSESRGKKGNVKRSGGRGGFPSGQGGGMQWTMDT